MRGLATFVMAGRGQAVLVTLVFALLSLLLPPASYVAGATVALVTLRRGWLEGLVVAAGAGLAVTLLGLLALGSPLPGLVLLALLWLPVWALAQVLGRASSQGAVLGVAAVAAATAIVVVDLLLGTPADWWRELLERSVVPAFEAQGVSFEPAVLQRLAEVMTGVVAAATVLGAVVSLLIGRWWQALLYNPGGFGAEFRGLRTDRRLALGTAAVVVALVMGGEVLQHLAAELLLVALIVYTLQGLAVAHALLGPPRQGRAWLVGIYVALVVLWPYPMLALGLAGWTDTWVDYRARMSGPGPAGPGGQSESGRE